MGMMTCFYGTRGEYGFLSNWYPAKFIVKGKEFSSVEQYMMYVKAMLFGDVDVAEEIMCTDDPRKIKALGRKVKSYSNTVWNGLRQMFVYEGLLAKFSQNPELKERLLSTKGSVLVECSPYDTIWGIGCSMRSNARFDMSLWRGQNLLGFTLMKVRTDLMSECSKEKKES